MTDEVIKQAEDAIFEKWILSVSNKSSGEAALRPDHTGRDKYFCSATQLRWEAWQAAYEIFRADFMRQLDVLKNDNNKTAQSAFAEWNGEMAQPALHFYLCGWDAALKAVAERIK